jgi:peroxiredoxin
MSADAEKRQLPFPYLHDETQAVAKSFGARLTPEAFVISNDGKIAYLGAIDDDVTLSGKPKKNHLRAAIESVLAGREPVNPVTRAFGCRIRWK